MSDPVRGRAMIINIENFYKDGRHLPKLTREGSYLDYQNIRRLFQDMAFDIVKKDEEMSDLCKNVCIQHSNK